jgi:tRNA dimethylallyltransferase
VHAQTGVPMGELRARHALGAPRHDALHVELVRPRPELAARIEQRVREMIDRGLADEVRAIVATWGADVRPLGAVGYRQMLAHVVAGTPLDETIAAIERATRTYARRQRVWLASEPGVDAHLEEAELLGAELDARIRAHLA